MTRALGPRRSFPRLRLGSLLRGGGGCFVAGVGGKYGGVELRVRGGGLDAVLRTLKLLPRLIAAADVVPEVAGDEAVQNRRRGVAAREKEHCGDVV